MDNKHVLPERFEKYIKHKVTDNNRNLFVENSLLIPCQHCHSAQLVDSGSVTMCHKCHVRPVSYTDHTTDPLTDDQCTVSEAFAAVAWVKDQLVAMKEEDKMLMQHFLDLRARIRKLRSHMTSMAASHLSTQCSHEVSASHLGIDESSDTTLPLDLNLSPHQEEDYLGEFRDRTVSMYNVHNPKTMTISTPRTIRKYRTEEYL